MLDKTWRLIRNLNRLTHKSETSRENYDEKIAATVCFLMFSLMLMALTTSVKAPNGSHFRWVNPAYMEPDMFYDTIVGYLEETWTFTTSWTNFGSIPLNVSAIRIYFDWGKNYTHNFSTPLQIMPGNTEIFQISNMTPSTEEAPELWTHEYIVYIDSVNSTSPPYENLSPIEILWRQRLCCVISESS